MSLNASLLLEDILQVYYSKYLNKLIFIGKHASLASANKSAPISTAYEHRFLCVLVTDVGYISYQYIKFAILIIDLLQYYVAIKF